MSVKETTPLLHRDVVQNKSTPHTALNTNREPYVGLTVEEVLLTSKDPIWIAIRIASLITFWLMILIMFTTSIVLIISTPGCVGANLDNMQNVTANHYNHTL